MLRSCRLCARQLEASRSLALSARSRTGSDSYHQDQDHHPPHHHQHLYQEEGPIASTSKLIIDAPHVSSSSKSVPSSASSCAFASLRPQRRCESTSAAAAVAGGAATHENRFEHDFRTEGGKKISSPWKGKARAVEVQPAPQRTPSRSLRLPMHDHPEQADKKILEYKSVVPISTLPAAEPTIHETRAHPTQVQKQTEDDGETFSSRFAAHFEAGLAEGDLAKCYSRFVHEYLYRFEQDRPHLNSNLTKRMKQLYDTFTGKPRSAAVHPLKSYYDDDRIPPLQTLVPLLAMALFDQMDYAARRTKFRQILVKTIDLLKKEGTCDEAEECLEAVLREYRRRRRWDAMEGTAPLALNIRGWTPTLLEHYLHALDQSGHHHKFPEVSELASMKEPLTRDLYDLLIKGHLCNRNLGAARAFLDQRLQAGIYLDAESFDTLQAGYRSLGGYETLLQDLAQLGITASDQLVHNMLAARIRDEGPAGAIEVLSLLDNRAQQEPALLSDGTATDQQGPPDSTESSVAEASSPKATNGSSAKKSSLLSYLSLKVYARAKLDDLDEAVDSYTQLLDTGVRPSAFITSTLLKAYRRSGTPQRSEDRVTPAFRATSGQHQAKVYRRLTSTILDNEGLDGLKKHLREMNEAKIRIADVTVSIIAKYLSGSLTAPQTAKMVRKLRRAHGSQLSVSDFNIVLQSVCERARYMQKLDHLSHKGSKVRRARLPALSVDLLDPTLAIIKQSLPVPRLRPDSYTVMLIMKRYADASGSPYKLWQFFRVHVLEAGFKPTVQHISALMTAYCNAGDLYGARRAMDRGQALGVQPTIQLWTILLQGLVRNRQLPLAHNLLLELQQHGFRPDLYVFAVLAGAHAETGNMEGILAYERDAKSVLAESAAAKWPNVVFETLKFNAWIVQRRHSAAHLQLAYVLGQGLEADEHLYSSVDNSYRSLQHLSRYGKRNAPELPEVDPEAQMEVALPQSTGEDLNKFEGGPSDAYAANLRDAMLGYTGSLETLVALAHSHQQRIMRTVRSKRKGGLRRLKRDIEDLQGLLEVNKDVSGAELISSQQSLPQLDAPGVIQSLDEDE